MLMLSQTAVERKINALDLKVCESIAETQNGWLNPDFGRQEPILIVSMGLR